MAVIDSGFDINNPEIADNIAEYRSFDYPDHSMRRVHHEKDKHIRVYSQYMWQS